MSQQLPVPVGNPSRLALPAQSSTLSSSLARMAIALAPDILRATEQVLTDRNQPAVPARQPVQLFQSQAVQLSEVEINTSLPFVRRVTVRNATSWTTTPVFEPTPVVETRRSRGRWIGISGALALLAAVAVSKAIPATGRIIDVPGRQRT